MQTFDLFVDLGFNAITPVSVEADTIEDAIAKAQADHPGLVVIDPATIA